MCSHLLFSCILTPFPFYTPPTLSPSHFMSPPTLCPFHFTPLPFYAPPTLHPLPIYAPPTLHPSHFKPLPLYAPPHLAFLHNMVPSMLTPLSPNTPPYYWYLVQHHLTWCFVCSHSTLFILLIAIRSWQFHIFLTFWDSFIELVA